MSIADEYLSHGALAAWQTNRAWVYVGRRPTVLHFRTGGPMTENEHEVACSAPGLPSLAACGLSFNAFIPGVFARLSMKRCEKCCEALSIFPGYGCPNNELARMREVITAIDAPPATRAPERTEGG